MQKKQTSFSFPVFTFNHERYIIEHLESIKYQIEKYGEGIMVDILINDDASGDRTVEFIEKWIEINKNLFHRIVLNFNKINKGTCASIIDLFSLLETEFFKPTAGDDIYSYENVFEAALIDEATAFVTGFPLFIENGVLRESFLSNLLMIATNVVYARQGTLKQFVNFSYNNAPNMFYSLACVQDKRVINFLQKFDVTEDWPLQISISRYFPEKKIKYIDKVFVYYRRTLGSTYIVANKRFVDDKLKIYRDLIENSNGVFEKLILKSRIIAFKNNNKLLSKLINLELYRFSFFSFLNTYKISRYFLNLNLKRNEHEEHLEMIRNLALVFHTKY